MDDHNLSQITKLKNLKLLFLFWASQEGFSIKMIFGFFQELKKSEKKISTPTPFSKIQSENMVIFFFWVKNLAKFSQKNREFVKENSIFGFIFCFSFLY